MPTWTTGPRHSPVRVGEPGGEVRALLRVHRPAVERGADLGSSHRLVEVAGERDVPRPPGRGSGGERVEQRGGGQLGGPLHADVGTQPRLDQTRLGRLGDDEDRRVAHRHDSTRAKSRAVRSVPITDPETFDRVPSARGR